MKDFNERTFEDWLKVLYIESNPQILDDDLSDKFNDYLGGLDTETLMRYAELYGREQYIAGIKLFDKPIKK